MSYVLCIWDPSRHPTYPTTDGEAFETMKRLSLVDDGWNPRFVDFANQLAASHAADPQVNEAAGGPAAFWGFDLGRTAADCKSAVYRMPLATDECIRHISYAVKAAADLGLIVFDDECGMCFLPDGTIFPDDMREIWEDDLAELKAGPPDPNDKTGDGRTFWERLGGELFNAIGSKR